MGCGHGGPAPAPFHKQYILCAKLGSGNFGQVWEIRPKTLQETSSKLAKLGGPADGTATQEICAVKICDLREEANGELYLSKQLLKSVQRELNSWRALGSHANCVQLLHFFMEDHLCYMIMEKCECTIFHKFEERLAATEEDLSACVQQMLLGISHLHALRVVHRDIKPENFLFADRTFKTVKLCDFGLAKKLPRFRLLRKVCGTAPYMSPEMVRRTGYAEKTDVWSCGVAFYLLLFGDLPYVVIPDKPGEFDQGKLLEAICVGSPSIPFARNPEHNFPPPSACAIELAKALLDRSPSTRCSANQALELPFLSQQAQLELEAPISPVVRRARFSSNKFKQHVDPTRQRTLDELLAILQEQSGEVVRIKRAFSEPITQSAAANDEAFNENSGFLKQITEQSHASGQSHTSQKLTLIDRIKSCHSTGALTASNSGDRLRRGVSPASESERSHASGTSSMSRPVKMSL